jgi:DNA-binding NtrC family response regulator
LRKALIEHCGGIEVQVPALRERVEDIPLLAQYALQNLHRSGQSQARSFRGAALTILENLPWPGNVRELNSAVAYAAIRADTSDLCEIGPEHLPQSLSEAPAVATAPGASFFDYQSHLARAELGLVEAAMSRFEIAKKSELAERLRYRDRFTFARRIRRIFEKYPTLAPEYPKARGLFDPKKDRHRSKNL